MHNVYRVIRSHTIESSERRRAAARLTLVLLGLISIISFRNLDGYLSEKQIAHAPIAPSYQSDFGSKVAAATRPQAIVGPHQPTYAF